MSNRIMAMT